MQIRLPDFFEIERFIPELKATNRDAALREMVETLEIGQQVRDREILLEMLRQREQLGSTGIGRGVAVPHGRSLAISQLMVVVARSTPGIDFEAMDSKPVHLIFLTAAPPQERANLYLPLLGKIVELVKSARVRKKLLSARDFAAFAAIMIEVDDDE
ncbi:MAG: PTS sugar transporter subunit IIA [Candidatus Eisenbacteria bacterium]|nr:PTS sugar transporter subunit IIA [Candidatus Eisenbacteria bacterium]